MEIPPQSYKCLKLDSPLHMEKKAAISLYSFDVFVLQKLYNFSNQISLSLANYFFSSLF